MRKIFLDTNILIDLIADRQPYSKFAVQIFSMAESKKLHLFTTSHSIVTTHYVLNKYSQEKALRETIKNLLNYITVIPVAEDILKKALLSNHKDFEDAVQINAAFTIKNLECIVTRNPRDFKLSGMEVLSPDEFCLQL